MAHDRYDTRRGSREQGPREQSRHSGDPYRDRRDSEDRDERGFFERAGDEISSWFGDEEAERRRLHDDRMGGRDDEHGRNHEPRRDFGRDQGRGRFERDDDRGYRPVTGDYGRSEGLFAAGGQGRGDAGDNWGRGRYEREGHRGASLAASSDRSRHDPHYQQWRQRQIDEIDRDYDEYRREHQSKFENDFGSWRSNRQTKRQMLGQIREHMEVVGNDDEHVGTIDRVAGDRIILTKSDPEAGGAHHSLSCSEIDRVEGDRVILGCDANEARGRWRDESRERALFEREDQGEAGPHALDRSFSGTYR